MRRLKEVIAARDMGDALECVVDDDRKVVGRPNVLAGEDHITEH